MFTPLSLFKHIDCPYHLHGLCDRPLCQFSHLTTFENSNSKKKLKISSKNECPPPLSPTPLSKTTLPFLTQTLESDNNNNNDNNNDDNDDSNIVNNKNNNLDNNIDCNNINNSSNSKLIASTTSNNIVISNNDDNNYSINDNKISNNLINNDIDICTDNIITASTNSNSETDSNNRVDISSNNNNNPVTNIITSYNTENYNNYGCSKIINSHSTLSPLKSPTLPVFTSSISIKPQVSLISGSKVKYGVRQKCYEKIIEILKKQNPCYDVQKIYQLALEKELKIYNKSSRYNYNLLASTLFEELSKSEISASLSLFHVFY
jgi:hypothetical protein